MSTPQRYAILVVDSTDNLAAAVRQTLNADRYDIISAFSAGQALAILTYIPVHIVLTRSRLEDGSGLEMLRHIKYIYPHVARVIAAESEEHEEVLRSVNEESTHFVVWDADPTDLATALRQAELYSKLTLEFRDLRAEAALNNRIMALIEELEPELLERIAPRVMKLLEE
jgi:DNA-binding NtrC family response regulator